MSSASVQPIAVKGTPRYKIAIEKVHQSNSQSIHEEQMDSLLEACLQSVLDLSNSPNYDESAMETDALVSSCPLMKPKKGIELLHKLAGTASRVEDAENRDQALSSILDLCVSLWGQLDFYNPAVDGKSTYVESQYRKEALSMWIESVSEGVVEEEVRKSRLDSDEVSFLTAIFSYMSSRKIAEACSLAQDHGCHHLALLLSQICLGSDIPRQMMHKQLMYWAEYGIDTYVSLQHLILYTLSAGLATHQAADVFVNTCLGLEWRRALALHLWYVCPATATIAEVLTEYEKACGLIASDIEPYCGIPRPTYALEQPALIECQMNHDICFHLLKLYVDASHPLDVILENSSSSPDPLDLTTCWLMWCILQSLDYTLISESKVSSLHVNMASLLESKGHWHWAAFVLLFITDENRRKKDILELLNRHLLVDGEEGEGNPFYVEKEHFLLNDLKLPIDWLHEAKAVRAKSLKLVDEEAFYSMKCGNFERAHKLIVDVIAPNAIINEDHNYLSNFLIEFKGEYILSQVSEWENGGGIYRDYLCLIEQIEEMKKTAQLSGSKVESLRPRLLGLCSKLNNLKCASAVQRLSISEMSRVSVSVLRAILGDNPEATKVLAEQVSVLPLTHECALEELNLIMHQYLTHVTMDTR